jgi:hypothetical protein
VSFFQTQPHNVSFCRDTPGPVVSVNLDGRAILLYYLHEKDSAVELSFQVNSFLSIKYNSPLFEFSARITLYNRLYEQKHYGHILGYEWCSFFFFFIEEEFSL